MPPEFLIYDKHDAVALIRLNRPDRLNALSLPLRRELLDACADAQQDDSVRAIVITGEGRGFCSGVDITGRTGSEADIGEVASQEERLDEFGWTGRQALGVYGLEKPTIAAMNGVCAGAGMSLALSCDLRVGSENARFRTVFLERNLSPDSGLSFLLPRIVGYSRAMDLILTSRDVGAEEAYRLGLLDRLVPQADLLEESMALAKQIARWPPIATRAAKRVVQQNLTRNLEDALRNETAHLGFARRATNDSREAYQARAERREPHFTGT